MTKLLFYIKKGVLLAFIVSIYNNVFTQNCSIISFNTSFDSILKTIKDTTICDNSQVKLFANIPIVKSTTSYLQSSIPYVNTFPCETGGIVTPFSNTGDDNFSPVFNLGFYFQYYNQIFQDIIVSPNGFISFTTTSANQVSSFNRQPLPLNGFSSSLPRNTIFGNWWDINVNKSNGQTYNNGTITYQTIGNAPYRAFIVKWDSCTGYAGSVACRNKIITMKIVLYETTNVIEVHTKRKDASSLFCQFTNSATQGIVGNVLSSFVVVGGRNNTNYSLTNDAVRFTPNGTAFPSTVSWKENNVIIGNTPSLAITPTIGNHTYIANATITSPTSPLPINLYDTLKVKVNPKVKTSSVLLDSIACSALTLDAGVAFKYKWFDNKSNRKDTVNSIGKYYVIKFLDSFNCIEDSLEFNISNASKLKITNVNKIGCFGVNDTGKATLNYNFNKGKVNWSIDKINYYNTDTIVGLTRLNNFVYAKDSVGCIDSFPMIFDTLQLTLSKTDNKCFSDSNGIIKAIPSNGISPYSFSLDSINYSSIDSFKNLKSKPYTIWVKDGYNCTNSKSTNILFSSKINVTINTFDENCANDSSGKIVLTSSNGIAPYKYKLDTFAYQTSDSFTKLTKKTYLLSISDSLNCKIDTNAIISTKDSLKINVTSDSVYCNGGNSGKIHIKTIFGIPPYSYSLDGGLFQNDSNFSNIFAGNHTVIIKDSLCFDTTSIVVFQPDSITLSLLSDSTLCFGSNNGTITATASGGTPPFAYSLDSISFVTNNVFANLNANSYKVFVKDKNNCNASSITQIFQPTKFSATTTKIDITCNKINTGSFTIIPNGGSAPYLYSLDNISYSSNPLFTNRPSGFNKFYLKDSKNCILLDSVELINQMTTNYNISADSVACFAQNNGKIFVRNIVGKSPITFSINAGAFQNDSSFQNLVAGTYKIMVKDSNNCLDSSNIVVAQPPVLSLSLIADSVACSGQNNGTITATASGGNAPFAYSLDSISFVANNVFANLNANSYKVFVKDNKNCTISANTLIYTPSNLSATTTKSDIVCNNNNIGSFNIIPNGGTAPYLYSIDNFSYSSNPSFLNRPSGFNKYYLKDSKNCILLDSVLINKTSEVSAVFSADSVACFAQNNGKIFVRNIVGKSPVTFSINAGAFQNDSSFQNLVAGTYKIMVKDSNNCLDSSNIVVAQPPVLSLSLIADSVACSGQNNGTITATASGGNAPFAYSLDSISFVPNNVFANLNANSYKVFVKDNKNCTISANTLIYTPSNLSATTTKSDIVCNNNNIGSFNIIPNGGTAPYLYSIDNFSYSSNPSFLNRPSGFNKYYLKDSKNCILLDSVLINKTSEVSAVFSADSVACFAQNNGKIFVRNIVGKSPITFSINAGAFQNDSSFQNLVAGTYKIMVKDSNNCLDSSNIVVAQPPVLSLSLIADSVACSGQNNGTITATASGGNAPFAYSLDSISFVPNNVFANLNANSYKVFVKDNKNCTISANTLIYTPSNLSASTTKSDIVCNNNNIGSFNIIPNGGTAPYLYSIDNFSYSSNPSFLNRPSGFNKYYLKDSKNCILLDSVLINKTSEVSAVFSADSVACFAQNNGKIFVRNIVGKSPVIFSINAGAFQNDSSFQNLVAGTYKIMVKDSNNCLDSSNIVVAQPPVLSLSLKADSVACSGQNNGTITATASGGNAPFAFSLDSISFVPNNVFANLNANSYKVFVKDNKNCTISANTLIYTPSNLSATTTKSDIVCNNNNIGSFNIIPNGGTAPYLYSLDNISYSSNPSFLNRPSGFNKYYLKDSKNCILLDSVLINKTSEVSAVFSADSVACFAQNNGKIFVRNIVGKSPITFSINAGAFQNDSSFQNLVAGTYKIMVKDSNNCLDSSNIVVAQPPVLSLSLIADSVACSGQNNGTITATASGGNAPFAYSLDSISFVPNNVFANLNANSYKVFVKDFKNCTISANTQIFTPNLLSFTLNIDSVKCNNKNDAKIIVSTIGGTAPFSYNLNNLPFSSNNIISNISSGTHTITVKDFKNCTYQENIVLNNPTKININVDSFKNLNCFEDKNGYIKISSSGGKLPHIYNWNNGKTISFISNIGAGNYIVTVTDANNCSVLLNKNLTQPSKLVASIDKNDLKCFEDMSGKALSIVSGGIAPYYYSWNTNSTDSFISNLSIGNYTLTVKDSHNCKTVANITIIQPDSISIVDVITNSSCIESVNGKIEISNTLGGTAPYSYLWNNTSQNSKINNLKAHEPYLLTITDANNCLFTKKYFIDTSYVLSINMIYDTLKCPNTKTDLVLAPLNGEGIYKYFINNIEKTSAVIKNLTNKLYEVSVIDANNCTFFDTLDFRINDSMVTNIIKYPPSCQKANEFSIKTITEGGAKPYTYIWSGNSFVTPIGDSAMFNKTGDFYVIIKDNNNCSKKYDFSLNIPPGYLYSYFDSIINVSCFDKSNGKVKIKTTGGLAPYKYIWSTGDTTNEKIDLYANKEYQVSIIDNLGCTYRLFTTLSQPDKIELKVKIKNESCDSQRDGNIVISSSGGSNKGFLYSIDSQNYTNNKYFTSLSSGLYHVFVKDELNCIVDTFLSLSTTKNIGISMDSIYYLNYDNIDPLIEPKYNNLDDSITYSWTPETLFDCNNCASTKYIGFNSTDASLKLTYGKNCHEIFKFKIVAQNYNKDSLIFIPTAFNPFSTNPENRVLKVYGANIIEMDMTIRNRWGEIVFYSNNQSDSWDGRFKELYSEEGVYVYEAMFKIKNGQVFYKKGEIMLMK